MVKTRNRHYIDDRGLEVVAGLALFFGGAVLLRDAYDSRDREQPRWLKVISWW